MEQRVVTKQLAGSEDIIKGVGTVVQARGTGDKTITKLNVSELQGALVVDDIAELEALDINLLGDTKTVIVNGSGTYKYDDSSWVKADNNVFKVNSIAELRDLKNSSNDLVHAYGYYAKGDGAFGSNIFEWDSTSTDTDNSGTVIKLNTITTGRYKLKYDGAINVKWFGAKGDGSTDDTVALQNALDYSNNVHIPSGTWRISDTLYIPRGIKVTGEGSSDAWSGRTTGTIIKTLGSGTQRIWTDVGEEDRPFANWYDLNDDTVTVAIVIEGDTVFENMLVLNDNTSPWDIGILNPACKRVTLNNVDTFGKFKLTGYYLSTSWTGNKDKPLYLLHKGTYGREVLSDGAVNECSHNNCYFNGGNIGVYGKGSDRDPELANSVSDLIWGKGGASDCNFNHCRFGNNPDGTTKYFTGGLILDWSYAYDVENKNSKYPQNRSFVGCSFRAVDCRYSCALDRTRFDQFFGVYGEVHGEWVTDTVNSSMYGNLVEISAPNPTAGTNGKAYKLVVPGSTPWRLVEEPFTIGATVTGATSGANFRIRGLGFDGTNRYLITRLSDVIGTFTDNEDIYQASGQTIASVFASNDRTQNTSVYGQSIFSTAAEIASIDGTYGKFGRLLAGSSDIRQNYVYLRGANNSMSLFDSGNAVIEGKNININSTELNLRSSATQVNLWANYDGSIGDRIRWTGTYFAPYSDGVPNLGYANKRWDTIYATNSAISTSDDRYKTYEDITDVENRVAIELKSNMRKFKFNDAIDDKGLSKARIHFGTSAQTVREIFESNGLKAEDYALFCYDEWDDEWEDEKLITKAGNRYGIRYEELLCFIVSAI